MQRLGDLFGIILNLIFVFTTVSYVASTAADVASDLLGWRSKLLLNSLKDLLDDRPFRGLARALYNNAIFNPLGTGKARSEAELDSSTLPPRVPPALFGQAMIEILGIEAAARQAIAEPDPDPADSQKKLFFPKFTRLADANLNARLAEFNILDGNPLKDLAVNLLKRHCNDPDVVKKEDGPEKIQAVLVNMITELGNWFDFSQIISTEKYRKRTRWVNFVFGFAVAAVLDLQPIPFGGGAVVGQIGVKVFEWLMVALATLFGASFWFEILKWLSSGTGGGGKPGEPATGAAGAAARVMSQAPTK
jgi:hypothetical protein